MAMQTVFPRAARAIAALALLMTSLGCAGQPHTHQTACAVARQARSNALVRLPFEIVQGRIYIQAQVNHGGPYRFAVDTGASGLGRADSSLVSALHLTVTGATQASDGVSTATVNTVHLNSLELGALSRSNLDVIARDYSSSVPPEAAISGILGRGFFADGLLVIDFPTHSLWFSRTRQLAAGDADALAYERAFRIPISLGDVATTANLDTGAAVGLVLPRSTFDQVSATPLEQAGRARLTNGVIETGRAIVHGPLRAGAINIANIDTRVSDRFPEAVLGGEILRNYVIAIDQRTQLVAICEPRS